MNPMPTAPPNYFEAMAQVHQGSGGGGGQSQGRTRGGGGQGDVAYNSAQNRVHIMNNPGFILRPRVPPPTAQGLRGGQGAQRQRMATSVVPLGPHPANLVCPFCFKNIKTEIKMKAGHLTFFACTLMTLLGCFCGCCLIPCFVDDCLDVHHKCPNCKTFLGRFRK